MLALLDHRAPTEAVRSLAAHGYEVLCLPSFEKLPTPVSAHADLLLYFAPDVILCDKGYFEIAETELKKISQAAKKPLRFIEQSLGCVYPKDVPLNAAPIGKVLFCNSKTVAAELIESDSEKEILSVKQGYTKCSILPVGSHALVTEDDSIAKRGRKHGLDVLRIEKGFVKLPGYDTGFLGGATSFSPYKEIDDIFFCGTPLLHPDGGLIGDFCEKHGKKIIPLGDFQLFDVGTIFLI